MVHMRTEAVLASTHNLCFGTEITKIVYPSMPQFFNIKVGCKGVYSIWTCFPDGNNYFRPFQKVRMA